MPTNQQKPRGPKTSGLLHRRDSGTILNCRYPMLFRNRYQNQKSLSVIPVTNIALLGLRFPFALSAILGRYRVTQVQCGLVLRCLVSG